MNHGLWQIQAWGLHPIDPHSHPPPPIPTPHPRTAYFPISLKVNLMARNQTILRGGGASFAYQNHKIPKCCVWYRNKLRRVSSREKGTGAICESTW